MKGKSSKRVDENGRAYAGSQRQIQTYVNEDPGALTIVIEEALPSLDSLKPVIQWVSPLKQDKYVEYHDEDFLCALKLDFLADELSEFWPKGGPHWDALAYVMLSYEKGTGLGVVLVEAKSHVAELASQCKASPESLEKTEKSLNETKQWLGVAEEVDWTDGYYQMANRLAHLCFFHKQNVPAWLVNIYFLNDPHTPISLEEWKKELFKVKQKLGLKSVSISYTADIFLEAKE